MKHETHAPETPATVFLRQHRVAHDADWRILPEPQLERPRALVHEHAEAIQRPKAALARLNAAGIPDRIFPLFRVWGDLRCMDPAIDPSDRAPGQCYRGDPAVANRTPSIGRANTIRTWLSMWSLETSKCMGEPHLSKFDMPALVVQGSADTGVFPSDARKIFDFIGSADKRLEMLPGAHYFEDSTKHRDDAADLMAGWIREKL